MTDEPQQHQCATRRCVLLGAGVLGATGVLTACSTASVPYDDEHDSGGSSSQSPAASPAGNGMSSSMAAKPSSSADSAMGGKAAASKPMGTLLGSTADVPVGGGVIFTAAKVAVTQPAKGEFKAFSAVCTHVGCLCNTVADGTINCPCHGGKFKITDGSVVAGPPPTALAAKTINVDTATGKIYLA